MTPTPQEIAARLSEHGKEAFDWVRPHSLIAPYRKGAREIERLGLVTWEGRFFSITPLGQQVRTILETPDVDAQ